MSGSAALWQPSGSVTRLRFRRLWSVAREMFLPLECLSVFEWRPVSDVETLRSDAVVSSDRPRVGLAVVGAGYWGPNLARNAQKTPGLKLEYLNK